jgi:hypothetical protein
MTLIRRMQLEWDQRAKALARDFVFLSPDDRQSQIDALARLDKVIAKLEAGADESDVEQEELVGKPLGGTAGG